MKAPSHLKPESKREWARLAKEFELDSDAALILCEYLEARERKIAAQAAIERDGITVSDRFGQVKAHPAAGIVRDCQALMLRALKALGLPLAAEADKAKPGRPTALESMKRGPKRHG